MPFVTGFDELRTSRQARWRPSARNNFAQPFDEGLLSAGVSHRPARRLQRGRDCVRSPLFSAKKHYTTVGIKGDSHLRPVADSVFGPKARAALFLAIPLLFGCTSEPVTSGWVASQTKASYDRFQKLSWTVGPYIQYSDRKGYSGNLYLCRASNESGWSEFLLCVENTSSNPERFTSAASMTGEPLSVQEMGKALSLQQMERHENEAPFQEYVGVVLQKDLLVSSQSSGLTVRLYGQGRDLDVVVPSAYIQGFMGKMPE